MCGSSDFGFFLLLKNRIENCGFHRNKPEIHFHYTLMIKIGNFAEKKFSLSNCLLFEMMSFEIPRAEITTERVYQYYCLNLSDFSILAKHADLDVDNAFVLYSTKFIRCKRPLHSNFP